MRGQSEETNIEVIRLAKKYHLAGVDLAGDELKYPTKEFKNVFLFAEKSGMPYTIHAGETGNLENVKVAIEFGAKRIGHGIALAQDQSMMEYVAKQEILLEMCPVCNIQTGAAKSWQEYPVTVFDEIGVKYCFNTDNRTVSNTTLTREFTDVAAHKQVINEDQVKAQTLQAIDYLFISETEKASLRNQVAHFYA
jgi:adenosine deaminase